MIIGKRNLISFSSPKYLPAYRLQREGYAALVCLMFLRNPYGNALIRITVQPEIQKHVTSIYTRQYRRYFPPTPPSLPLWLSIFASSTTTSSIVTTTSSIVTAVAKINPTQEINYDSSKDACNCAIRFISTGSLYGHYRDKYHIPIFFIPRLLLLLFFSMSSEGIVSPMYTSSSSSSAVLAVNVNIPKLLLKGVIFIFRVSQCLLYFCTKFLLAAEILSTCRGLRAASPYCHFLHVVCSISFVLGVWSWRRHRHCRRLRSAASTFCPGPAVDTTTTITTDGLMAFEKQVIFKKIFLSFYFRKFFKKEMCRIRVRERIRGSVECCWCCFCCLLRYVFFSFETRTHAFHFIKLVSRINVIHVWRW